MPAAPSNIEYPYDVLIEQMAHWPSDYENESSTPKVLKDIVYPYIADDPNLANEISKQNLIKELKEVEEIIKIILKGNPGDNHNDEPYYKWVKNMIKVLESDGMEMDGGRRKSRKSRNKNRKTRNKSRKSRRSRRA
jgi:hypothetical protein